MKKEISIKINLSWLKIIGSIVVIIGLYGFILGLYKDRYVMEAISVVAMGLGTLGYRKHLISKNLEFKDHKE